MRLLLIVANETMQGWPSLGVAYLASYLRRYMGLNKIGIWQYIPKNAMERIKRLSPDIIGIGASAVQFPIANSLAYQIRRDLDIPVILGGPHISSLPDYLPECYGLGVVGEGEQTLLEVLQSFEQTGFDAKAMNKIKGIVFRRNSSMVRTPRREPIVPLDRIPIPARDLIDMEDYISEDNQVFGKYFGRGTMMFTSRGCPYRCAFCSARQLWGSIRFNSPEYVVDEMNHLIKTYSLEYIHLYDDLFVANAQRVRRIADLVEQEGLNKRVKFGAQGRANLMTEKLCQDLKRMGVVQLSMGMESGVERVLGMLKNGMLTTQHIRNAVGLCKKHGFEVDGSFIIGSPTETKEEMLKTLDFIRELGLDKFAHFIATPYPGTQLWDYAIETGQIPGDPKNVDWSMFRMNPGSVSHGKPCEKQFIFTDTESRATTVGIWQIFENERTKLYSYRWQDRIEKRVRDKKEKEFVRESVQSRYVRLRSENTASMKKPRSQRTMSRHHALVVQSRPSTREARERRRLQTNA